VFVVPGSEVSAGLSYVRFPTTRACKFINPGLCECIALVCVV